MYPMYPTDFIATTQIVRIQAHPVLQYRDKLDFNKKFKNPECENHSHFLALALAGEAGEIANVAKKEWRDDSTYEPSMMKEMADVYVYLLLLARARGIQSLDEIAIYKLHSVACKMLEEEKKS